MNFFTIFIRKIAETPSIFFKNKILFDKKQLENIYKLIDKKIKNITKPKRNLKKTHIIFNSKIIQILKNRKKLKNFLRIPFIQKVFFVQNRIFIFFELLVLYKSKKWNFYSHLINENPTGDPVRYFLYPWSSGNRINHVFHLSYLYDFFGDFIKNINFVFEFGGGYGCMASIFQKINKNKQYIIFDTELVNLLQYYYLSLCAFKVKFIEDKKKRADILLTNNLKEINKQFNLLDKKKYLYIANWSISETPIYFRKNFEKILFRSEYFIIAFQERFENINNLKYFKKIDAKINKKFQSYLIKNNYYKGSIFKKQNHYFYIGKKL